MHFDHLPQFPKAFSLSDFRILRPQPGRRKVLEEIAKCEVVCVMCHRKRTAARKTATPPVAAGGAVEQEGLAANLKERIPHHGDN
jgi:hypothetical protein